MAVVALIVASRALKVLHLAVDGLAADDVQYLPALQGMQATSAWSHTLKAEPYTDSAHGWQVANSPRTQPVCLTANACAIACFLSAMGGDETAHGG
jgi:hypothetical protein